MVSIAVSAGRRCTALLSDMNQPLGQAVGNALEVREAIHTLHGKGPEDFREHCLVAAAHMLVLGQKAGDASEGRSMAEEALDGGGAWERFTALIAAQGGDVSYVEDPDRLPKASRIETIPAPRGGYLRQINARIVGETAVVLGAGREKKGDPIDHAVGIEIFHNVGDRIEEGQPLFAVHANEEGKLQEARQRLLDAHIWSDSPVEPLPLFYDVIQDTDIHSKAP
jgi:pyrimidine-nucleoside phosphorylase